MKARLCHNGHGQRRKYAFFILPTLQATVMPCITSTALIGLVSCTRAVFIDNDNAFAHLSVG
jgi:hypothetical protein